MSYKQRFKPLSQPTQLQQQKSPLKNHNGRKIATLLLASLPMLTMVGVTASISGCGFHLRGYDAPLNFGTAKTAVIIQDDRVSFPLKLPLIRRLESLGVDVVDGMTLVENADNALVGAGQNISSIAVSNVRFRRYELVGVLTEIRLVLSADVTYITYQEGEPVTLTNLVQVERSYQYNEASVSNDDLQGSQIRDWLYAELAKRITNQYVALELPKVPAESPAKPLVNPVTTVITPDP